MRHNCFIAYFFSSNRKFSLNVLLNFCLIICQFQSGVAYKIVAYKKTSNSAKLNSAQLAFFVSIIRKPKSS